MQIQSIPKEMIFKAPYKIITRRATSYLLSKNRQTLTKAANHLLAQ